MTPRQAAALTFIRARIEATGATPSYAEVAEAIGLVSRANIKRIVDVLIRDGHLQAGRRGSSRSISLPDANLAAVSTGALVAELERRGWRHG